MFNTEDKNHWLSKLEKASNPLLIESEIKLLIEFDQQAIHQLYNRYPLKQKAQSFIFYPLQTESSKLYLLSVTNFNQ